MANEKFNSLFKRSLTGIFFVAVIVGGLVYSPLSSFAVLGIAMYFCVTELLRLTDHHDYSKSYIAIVKYGSMLIYTLSYLHISGYLALKPMLWPMPYLIILGIVELYNKKSDLLHSISSAILNLIYIVLPFTLAHNILFYQGAYNANVLLSIFLLIWANDSFAYLFGISLGKHKLWERISPKKSWEGLIGGGLTTIILSYFIAHYFLPNYLTEIAGLAIIVVIFGSFGDLFESQLKRQCNIKDSGTLLPGHGGFLDRFDSFLFIIPVSILYLELLNSSIL